MNPFAEIWYQVGFIRWPLAFSFFFFRYISREEGL